MKYALYLLRICVILSIIISCKNNSAVPQKIEQGEILFRITEKEYSKRDTHFVLLIIKKNKVKTVYLHQRPHFATIRTLNKAIIQQVFLENKQRKVVLFSDTLPKKYIRIKDMRSLSDTLFWNTSARRYVYAQQDTILVFTTLNINVSPSYIQDIPAFRNCILDVFPVHTTLKTQTKQTEIQVIRMENKDIADIEFEYP